jgi:hypothetical protein
VWEDYQEDLGRQVLGGGEPTLNWVDYLNKFPFEQRFKALPPSERGETTRRFAPRTRFSYG